MAAPAGISRQSRWSTKTLLQPLLLLAIVVGYTAACVSHSHVHGLSPNGFTEPALTGVAQPSEFAPANGEMAPIQHLGPAGKGHGHAETTCLPPLSVALRESRITAPTTTVVQVMADAPEAVVSDPVQSWTRHRAEHQLRQSAAPGQLLDLLCVSRT